MSVHFKHLFRDRIYGCEYSFDEVGDTIPPHRHVEHMEFTAHSVECLSGRVGVSVIDGPSRGHVVVLRQLDSYALDYWLEHWITALEAGSVVFHPFIHGQPEAHKAMSDSELTGTLA